MLRVWKSVLAGVAALTACAAAGEAAAGLLPPAEHNRAVRSFDQRPMIFFVVRGPADSCGKGCNEWIAAAGTFDDGAPQRFQTLIDKLGDRNLPIFFHSPGGLTGAGVRLGIMLRERRMTAGLGRTEASCRVFDKKDKACQSKIAAGEPVSGRLSMGGGACFSACVEAFVGAPSRRIAPTALVGVHAARFNLSHKEMQAFYGKASQIPSGTPTMADFRQAARRYYVEMGVSADLPDFAAKIPHNRIYALNRNELARFGLEIRGDNYATPWTTSDMPAFVVVKSITRRTTSEPAENLTTRLFLACAPDGKPMVVYRRDLATNPDQATTLSRLSFDHWFIELTAIKTQAGEETGAFASSLVPETLTRFASAKTLTVTERMHAGEQNVLETKSSNAGLAGALADLQKNCVPSISVPVTSPIGTMSPVTAKSKTPTWAPDAMPKLRKQ